jgi:hypothetical protein
MRWRYVLGSLVAVFLALVPTTVLAGTYTEPTVAGIETGVPVPGCAGDQTSLSSFAGLAFGSINGVFTASVCHTPLTSTGANIVGGVFTLTNGTTTASGEFTGGTITPSTTTLIGNLCLQKFAVVGSLTKGGSFSAILTHYAVGAACAAVFFATVRGSATVNT